MAYVSDIVRDSVRDLQGRPASCFCALSISVGFDGPTSAVAFPGSSAAGAAAAADGAAAQSGRSGDSTAVSVTGGGSAAASATSGSTGAVLSAGSAAPPISAAARPAAATRRTTTVDVSRMTDALRSLVDGLGNQMAQGAGVATHAQTTDLLGGLGSRDSGRAKVDVALWDGAGDDATDVRCSPVDDGSHLPSCGVAIAISAHAGAMASVQPSTVAPTGGSLGADSTVGAPGMATAISVAVTGAAVSSARTGDQGSKVPHGATLEGLQAAPASLGSAAAARSGSSGDSLAVALTVRGAAATSSRSGDTGSALSAVSGDQSASAAGNETMTGTVGAPGSGGAGHATVQSGDSGEAGAWSAGVTGADGAAASGDTGDASASAADGAAGHDWSDLSAAGSTPGSSGGAVGGAGGAASADAATGHTGRSFSLVISGGSATADASSGPTGDGTATATGGTGGDTQVAASGTGPTPRSGDGGVGDVSGRSGATGDALSLLVTPYDGKASSRSGKSGATTSSARGGNAGCAANGVSLELACRNLHATDTPDDGGTAVGGSPASVTVRTRSAGSADVVCRAGATSRRCSSKDTAPVHATASGAQSPDATDPLSGSSDSVTGTSRTNADLRREMTPAGPAGNSTTANGTDVRLNATGVASGTPAPDERPGLIVLLVNAAVPILALLSLLALWVKAKKARAARTRTTSRHRRKQSLPTPASTRPR